MHPSAASFADVLPQHRVTAARRWALAVVLALFLLVLLRNAWAVEDAYITFRTVDNLVHGYGATWNVAERVQAYTHPLWMLLMAALYAFTHDVYYTSIVLSIVLTLAAVAGLGFGIAASAGAAAIAAAVLLVSKAFVDFSASGLENPLTHLLAIGFLWTWWSRPRSADRLLRLSLWAGLVAVTRMDALLLFAPALALEAVALRGRGAVRAIALGFTPFVAWEAFSLLYYGFPFPNPAYAKLSAGISHLDLAAQGLRYFRNSIVMDPPTLITIAAGIGAALVRRGDRLGPIAAGIALYLVYVVAIGGDFMSGRFFTVPLLCAAAVIARLPLARPRAWAPAAGAIALLVAVSPHAPVFSGPDYRRDDPREIGPDGIADERGYYFQATGLFRADGGRGCGHRDAARGRRIRRAGRSVGVGGNIGYLGFYAGPEVHIVDVFALADPLLARLPARGVSWRVGHYVRDVPPGYRETIERGRNVIEDPRIHAVYDGLARVIRAPLLDTGRLREIWRFNTGGYRAQLDPLFASRRLQERGEREIAGGHVEEAIATLKRSLELDPRRGASWYLLFVAHRDRDALDEARAALLRAIALAPGRYDGSLLELATRYQAAEAYAPAADLCETYLSRHPDSGDAHATLALSCEHLGRRDEAIAHYERALAIDPGFEEVSARLQALKREGSADGGEDAR